MQRTRSMHRASVLLLFSAVACCLVLRVSAMRTGDLTASSAENERIHSRLGGNPVAPRTNVNNPATNRAAGVNQNTGTPAGQVPNAQAVPPAGGANPPAAAPGTAPAAGTPGTGTAEPAAACAAPAGGDTYQALFSGAFKDCGQWNGQGFVNPALERMSQEMQAVNGCPAGGGGGDFQSTLPGVPQFFTKWRHEVSCCPWDRNSEAKARIAEAYFRNLVKSKWRAAGLGGAASVEEHLANLWYSNKNGKSKYAGGPGNIYCAAASSIMLCRGLQKAGFQTTNRKAGSYWNKALLFDSGRLPKMAPLPGDVLSYVGAGTPRTGHVVTVAVAENQTEGNYFGGGGAWVVSGNAGPCGTVAIDYAKFEQKPTTFNPFQIDPATKAPLLKWAAGEKRPAPGMVWTYSLTRTSQVQPSVLAKMTPDQIAAAKITPCAGGPTGCPCPIPESPPFSGPTAAAPPAGTPSTQQPGSTPRAPMAPRGQRPASPRPAGAGGANPPRF